jgi:hypothetical protein
VKIGFNLFFILLTIISGCALRPMYKSPLESEKRAFLKIEYESDEFMPVGRFDHLPEIIKCDQPEDQVSKLALINKGGNPLLSNVNVDGVWIKAEEKFIISSTSIPANAGRVCSDWTSFTPRDKASYEAKLVQREEKCAVTILEIVKQEDGSIVKIPVNDAKQETCIK